MCVDEHIDCHYAIIQIHFPQIHKMLGFGYITLNFQSLFWLSFSSFEIPSSYLSF